MANISVDFYGNLNKYFRFWEEFLKYIVLEGHIVYVIGGIWPQTLMIKLTNMGYKLDIHYHGVFSVLEELRDFGFQTWFDETHDSWYSDEFAWWATKAEICRRENIAIHFDNNIQFAESFVGIPTRFIHTESKKGETITKNWHKDLKLANTYGEDYDDWIGTMTSFIPG